MDGEKDKCDLNRAICKASPDELKAFYFKLTGKPLPDEKIIDAMRGEACDFGPGITIEKTGVKEIMTDLTIQNLQTSAQEELDAQRDYITRANVADAAGDTKTAELFREISRDEHQHETELTKRYMEAYK